MTQAGRFRMRDLERLTGVGRETIRYYIREGLLPEPERPRRNTAWYDGAFVERLRLIRELQQKRFLPLHVIKAIVAGDAPPPRDEVRTLLELDGKLFPAVENVPSPPPETLSAVAKRTGLSAMEIRSIADVGAITLRTEGGKQWLDETSLRIVEMWARIRRAGYGEELGFTPANLRLYVELVGWLAREELRLFARGVTGKVDTERSARMAEEGITAVGLMLAEMRKATLLRFIAEGNVPSADAEAEPLPKVVGVPPRIG
jgi:DNA-binding transcriptional MerR regulator